jgi:hypothetical protein
MRAGLRLTCLRQVRGIACRIILSWCCVPLLAGPLGAAHGRRAVRGSGAQSSNTNWTSLKEISSASWRQRRRRGRNNCCC